MTLSTVDIFHDKQADASLDGAAPSNAIKAGDYNAAHKVNIATLGAALAVRTVTADPNGTLSGPGIAIDTTNNQVWINTGGTVWTTLVRTDGVTVLPRSLFLVAGDSHAAGGAGDPSKADSAFNVTTPNTGALMNGRYASGSGVDPPSWTDFDSDLVMRSTAPHASGSLMGCEITMGSSLAAAGIVPATEVIAGLGYLLDTNWKPSSTFMLASTGTNLFNTSVARMQSLQTSTSRQMAGVVLFVGANDIVAGGAAVTNYGTNLTAMMAGYRAAFGATLPIVVVRVSSHEAIDPTNLATVRAAQASVVAADAHAALIDTDDLPLAGDVLHFTARSNLTIGDRVAFALRLLMGLPLPNVTTTPTVIGWGPSDFGSGNLTPTSYAGVRDGDLELMPVMNGVLSGSAIATPSGWTAVGSLTTTGATGLFVNFRLFARVVTTAMLNANNGHTAPTSITATDDRNIAKIFAVRGPNALTLSNIDASSFWPENAFANPKTIPSTTTLTDNAGVIVFSGGWVGSNIGRSQALTNGTLTSFVKLQDGADPMPATDALALAAHYGKLASHGATGAFTDTVTGGNMIGLAITVAVKP